ncbi:hypothetical protein [Nonomuraea diastatica]|uniref:hypothetical protein n=1 Tax=Nonomuraea diastatica TaxID=1848329 RepID=UPI001C7032A0|nr:hypothetical protein [Nonomuraea diastatica]
MRTEPGAGARSSGSDTTCAPTGTTAKGLPENVTGRAVPGRIVLTPARPPSGSATEAAVMGSGAPPNALEKRTRSRDPPADTRTLCRSVPPASTRPSFVYGGGGMLPGSVSCGMAVHVLTQRLGEMFLDDTEHFYRICACRAKA